MAETIPTTARTLNVLESGLILIGQNQRGSDGNIIAIGIEAAKTYTTAIKSSFEEGASFLINYGAGITQI